MLTLNLIERHYSVKRAVDEDEFKTTSIQEVTMRLTHYWLTLMSCQLLLVFSLITRVQCYNLVILTLSLSKTTTN